MINIEKSCIVYDLQVDNMAYGSMSMFSAVVVTGSRQPVFSWKIAEGTQRRCRITVATAPEKLSAPDMWDSGWLDDASLLGVKYSGRELASRMQLFCQLEVELTDGRIIGPTRIDFTVGLLEVSDWQGKWIYADGFEHLAPAPAPYFRRKFAPRKDLKRAMLFAAAKGLVEMSLNGRRVDEHDFLPGWSDFSNNLQYVAYDVSHLLTAGEDNLLGVMLGDGWYVSSFPGYNRTLYGTYPEMLIQLELEYADNSRELVVTDSQWRWSYGALLAADIFDGENYHAMREDFSWQLSDFDDSAWRNAQEKPFDANLEFVRKLMPGVGTLEYLEPVAVNKIADGLWVYDFGRNVAGRVRLTFEAAWNCQSLRGRLRYAEAVNADGTLYNVNYRSADSVDCYMAKVGENCHEAYFTFHGFRYVQLEVFSIAGWGLKNIHLQAAVLTSDMKYIGDFECADKSVNQLVRNIRTSMQGNFLEVPTDCPQRDERLGWSGDAHMFFQTALFLADCGSFFRKYLADLRSTQREDGAICSVAPKVTYFQYGSVAWADALPIIAWRHFLRYGNKDVIAENYSAVRKYLQFQLDNSEDLIIGGHPDHLSMAPKAADQKLIGTVFFKNCATIAANMAAVLELPEDYQELKALEAKILQSFRKHYLDDKGVLTDRTQSSFALLFYFDMISDPEEIELNRAIFKELIVENNYQLNTGFLGTAYLCPALVKVGLERLACDLLLQRNYPSWLYEVELGATSIWERWNSYHPETGFANPIMNSFNHYANGAVGEFLFEAVAGIRFAAYDGEKIAPKVHFHFIADERLGFARSRNETPCGWSECAWELTGDGRVHVHCLVPPDTTGAIDCCNIDNLAPGEHDFYFDLQ